LAREGIRRESIFNEKGSIHWKGRYRKLMEKILRKENKAIESKQSN
jgi:hypothetical protein